LPTEPWTIHLYFRLSGVSESSTDGVIISFLSGLVPGLHAAGFCFWAKVIPAVPQYSHQNGSFADFI
jgi:TctA family transporter